MAGSSEPAFSFLAQTFDTKRSCCSINDYSSILQQPLKFMVKNKVVLKERDARSDLANFIGEKKYKNIC